MRLTESPVKTRSVAFLLGIASVAAFAPFGGFPLIWLTLGGLFALLETGRISLAEALKFADSRTDLSLKFKLERGFSADDAELKVLRDG